jgi:rSAM/selenodomain-associated transferase 2/rSAM/selenodomain-associated transferase 1
MTEHILARLWPLQRRRTLKLEVRFDGGSCTDMRQWLGHGFDLVPQGDGDLGERMHRAANDALVRGAQAVVIVGADCPDLDVAAVAHAFDQLQTHSLVFGPARDGGYYLVGLRAHTPHLFEGISWGTDTVLAASLAKAHERGIQPFLLPELSDIDAPHDLETWWKARSSNRTLSVIIPALNEAKHLRATLEHAGTGPNLEVIVADGGSHDDTPRIAESCGAKLVTSPPHRAHQMNAAAAIARGQTLLFLHADTLLPANYCDAIFAALRRPAVVGGAFSFKIRDPFPGRRLVESSTNFRSRFLRMPYGDQALFVRRWAFDEAGGFPDLPIMEDYEFLRSLRRLGEIALLDAPILTSGRRWQRLGLLRTTAINSLLILGYHFGVAPAKLATFYRRPAPVARPTLDRPAVEPRAT